MPNKSYEEEYDYDEEHDDRRVPRKFKKAEPLREEKKRWDRENIYSRTTDYDERR